MKNILTSISLGAVLFFSVLAAPAPASAAFSNASLNGGYSFQTNLWTADVNTNPIAVVGVMTFDGAGNVTAPYTSVTGSTSGETVKNGTFSGTYTVKSNGTGEIDFTSGSTAHYALTLNSTADGVAHGVQLLQINDSNNEVVSGSALLQSTTAQTYSVASLKGPLAFQGAVWTADLNEAEAGGIGIFNFDGTGNVKAPVTFMFGGSLETHTFKGTYIVNSDGTGQITFPKNAQFGFALNSVTKGLARGLQFVATKFSDGSGNFVESGTAVKQ
jgi:hypothetical protein